MSEPLMGSDKLKKKKTTYTKSATPKKNGKKSGKKASTPKKKTPKKGGKKSKKKPSQDVEYGDGAENTAVETSL